MSSGDFQIAETFLTTNAKANREGAKSAKETRRKLNQKSSSRFLRVLRFFAVNPKR
jgi:hypothetical protein